MANYTFNFNVGDASLAVNCEDEEVMNFLNRLYGGFQSYAIPDITINLQIQDTTSLAVIKSVPANTVFHHEGSRFWDSRKIVEGRYNLDAGQVHIIVERNLIHFSSAPFYLNQIVGKLYYTSMKMRGQSAPPAFIVHSSCVIRNGKGLLFVGPSGIGKTTIARFYSQNMGTEILNDEGTLITRPHVRDGILEIRGIPIIGQLPYMRNTRVPLQAVVVLKQGKKTVLRPLGRTDAFMCFIRQVHGPLYFGYEGKKKTLFSLISEFSDQVTQCAPFFELEFIPNDSKLFMVLDELDTDSEKEADYER